MGFSSFTRPGRGVNKEDLEKTGAGLYFDIFFRRIWKLMTLNLLYLVVSIPAIIISWTLSSYFMGFLASLLKMQVPETIEGFKILTMLVTVVFFQLLGSGPASAAMCYVLKKFIKDSHAWVFSDFFEQMKKNFKQGLAVYFINAIVGFLLVIAYFFYSLMMRGSLGAVLELVVLITAIIFVMMQMYTYQLMVQFNLKVKHIYKNSCLLTLINLPWNILITAVTALFMYTMYSLALPSPFLAVIILALLYFVLISFTQLFMTNKIINKYMVDPAVKTDDGNCLPSYESR